MERDIMLGPFFTIGAVLVGVAARRRSLLLAEVGAAAMVADQRLSLARRLKERLRGSLDTATGAGPTQVDPPH